MTSKTLARTIRHRAATPDRAAAAEELGVAEQSAILVTDRPMSPLDFSRFPGTEKFAGAAVDERIEPAADILQVREYFD